MTVSTRKTYVENRSTLIVYDNCVIEMSFKEVAHANRLMYKKYMTVSARKTDAENRSITQLS